MSFSSPSYRLRAHAASGRLAPLRLDLSHQRAALAAKQRNVLLGGRRQQRAPVGILIAVLELVRKRLERLIARIHPRRRRRRFSGLPR